eukprot:7646583-Alexandrium_andersonii.AAC.1
MLARAAAPSRRRALRIRMASAAPARGYLCFRCGGGGEMWGSCVKGMWQVRLARVHLARLRLD